MEIEKQNFLEGELDLSDVNELLLAEKKIDGPTHQLTNELVMVHSSKLIAVKKTIDRLRGDLSELSEMISVLSNETSSVNLKTESSAPRAEVESGDGKIVEGVFDGEKMIGSDGQIYSVPVNYASKSKLVEGDILKLIVTNTGAFIFKQIGPIERVRLVGIVAEDEQGNYWAVVDNRRWRVLTASVTYFKGEVGDEVTILAPKEGTSRWAAVENIVHRNPVISNQE